MAARYWVGGTANWDGTAGTKWATTSGGAGGAAVPTSADDVYFDANSGAVTVTTLGTQNCLTLNTSGFTGTLTFNSTLNLNGSLTISATTTINGSSGITFPSTTTATITSNGVSIGCNMTFGSTNSITLADNLTITGTTSVNSATINGNTLNVKGNLTATGNMTGTPTTIFEINGTGNQTWSGNFNFRNPLTINKSAGTLTISGSVAYNTGTLTYTAGTVVTTGSTLTISASTTLNTNGITWNNVTFNGGSQTITLSSNLTCVNLTCNFNARVLVGSTIYVSGDFTNSGDMTTGCTTTIVMNGTGTYSGFSRMATPLVFNTSGTITISGSVRGFLGGSYTYTAGTINASGSTLTLESSITIDTGGMSWDNIIISSATNVTLNSLLSVSGTFTLANNVFTFLGTSGFSVANFTHATLNASRTWIFVSGVTYTITNSFVSNTNTSTIRPLFRSSVPASQAILTLAPSATQDLKFVNATDIDSSGGQTINSNKAVLSNATNWYRTNGTFLYAMIQ